MSSQAILIKPSKAATRKPARPLRVTPVSRTERKLATVLFADLKGSTDICRRIELEDWWTVMSGLYDLLCEGVHRFGGSITNFTGDGIKAIFEADAAEDHAVSACEAALWLQAAMGKSTYRPRLALRVGINSGEILTGTVGDARSRCYTATGYAVVLSKRMEGLAAPGRVYLTHYTAALAASRLELNDLGRFVVKGAEVPVGVYELTGIGS
jgi:class 3 adenylate cyclase